ncbi:uncharacterized protein [Macrobrachium rosenbergii]|uniref:uncharacterized protein isoform X2 n=1 Tax=Macrobrachium rosenbergii TaxID=79674 RepID=UPI0034D5A96A
MSFKFVFFFTYENTPKEYVHNLPGYTGWLIASISTGISFYGNERYERWVTQVQQRDLRITTNYQLQLEVFPMPLEPEETRKLPGITTGMSTVTPTSKLDGPLIGTPPVKPEGPPTVTSPVKPEGPPTVTPPVKPEGPPTGTATGIPASTLIIIGVVVALLVVVAASYLCYRCYFKKQNETRPEGIAMEEHPGTVTHPGSSRTNLSQNTENPLYGKIAPRDVTGIVRPLHRDRWPQLPSAST